MAKSVKAWAIKLSKTSDWYYSFHRTREAAREVANEFGWRDPVHVVQISITEIKPKRRK